MRAKFEGAFHPGAGIAFDGANTLNGGYTEATPEAKHEASLAVVSNVPKREARGVLEMLGIVPPRPGRE